MPKERNFNPVQEQRKAEKAKAIKKGKTEANARRNEKLAKRNPERIKKQIDDLKQITTSGGKLTKHEETLLESLERDLKSVSKAREALGDQAPSFSRGGRPGDHGVLGKRRRGGDDVSSDDGDVPDDVKVIPMPRDTPPPISKDVLDKWYAKRRARRTNANDTPLGEREGRPSPRRETPAQVVAPVEVKTIYEAKPVIRDLKKEAVNAFMPTAVRMKLGKGRGKSGLIEPEEADRLEREGYLKMAARRHSSEGFPTGPQTVTMVDAEEDED